MKKLNPLRMLFSVTVAVIAATSMGFEEDKPSGAKFYPEQSQEQLAKQQALTGTIPVVGVVEDKLDPVKANGEIAGQGDSGSFASAEAAKAKASFGAAGEKIAEKQNPLQGLFLFAMIAGLMLLAALGFKAYTDKVVPLPKSLQR